MGAVSFLIHILQGAGDFLFDAGGGDVVLHIMGALFFAAAIGFINRRLHRAGHPVGIQDRFAVDIARTAADGLDQRGGRAQEAFFIRIENTHAQDFGNVEALAQQIDADQNVEDATAQILHDFDAL